MNTRAMEKALETVIAAFKFAGRVFDEQKENHMEVVDCDIFFDKDGHIADDNNAPIRISFRDYSHTIASL